MSSVIKLFLRIKKLYEAMWELRKCIHVVVKQDNLFDSGGVIYQTMNKYLDDPSKVLEPEDEKVVVKGCQVLQKVSRKLASFKLQHKIFKTFRYREYDHADTLLWHAGYLSYFLQAKQSSCLNYHNPSLDQNGMLLFEEIDLASSQVASQVPDRMTPLSPIEPQKPRNVFKVKVRQTPEEVDGENYEEVRRNANNESPDKLLSPSVDFLNGGNSQQIEQRQPGGADRINYEDRLDDSQIGTATALGVASRNLNNGSKAITTSDDGTHMNFGSGLQTKPTTAPFGQGRPTAIAVEENTSDITNMTKI